MTRLKLCLHLTSQARRAREMQLCHPALLDPAASPDVPTPPSGLVQAPAHIAGCDGAQHAGSAAPMVPRACSWPHWWPQVDTGHRRGGGTNVTKRRSEVELGLRIPRAARRHNQRYEQELAPAHWVVLERQERPRDRGGPDGTTASPAPVSPATSGADTV